jgi:hypothetical protein
MSYRSQALRINKLEGLSRDSFAEFKHRTLNIHECLHGPFHLPLKYVQKRCKPSIETHSLCPGLGVELEENCAGSTTK